MTAILCRLQLLEIKSKYFKSRASTTRVIGLISRVFANGPGDLGSIPGRVIPKN